MNTMPLLDRRPALRRALMAMILASAVASGCGGGTQSQPPTSAPASPSNAAPSPSPSAEPEMTFVVLDACALLDQHAAEKIANTPLETGQPGNPQNPSCTYSGPVTGPLAQVSIYIGDGAKKTYDIDVELKHEFAPVPGVGDEAYLENNAMFVRHDTTWVAIELARLNDPAENAQALIDAAKLVIGQLP
jgi:hypothetical protein